MKTRPSRAPEALHPLLTVSETSSYLRLSRNTIMRLIDAGTLPVTRLKGTRRLFFRRADLEQLLEANTKRVNV